MNFMALTAAVLFLVLARPAAAYFTLGNPDCAEVTAAREDEVGAPAMVMWVFGYITARNYERDATAGEFTDDLEILDLILNYCREHPGNDLDDASINIYDSLK